MSLCSLIFPANNEPQRVTFGLLLGRILFGGMLATHGYDKLMAFSTLSTQFPDPIGFGSTVALSLVIFAELFCAVAVMFGLFTRLALIPIIFNMFMAIMVAHQGSIFKGELPALFLFAFVVLFIAGPGRCSIDQIFAKLRR